MTRESSSNAGNPILIGLGANLPSTIGSPEATLEAALTAIEEAGLKIAARSPWYESAPVPLADQPWYVNGVARIESGLGPAAILETLHGIEARIGRVRTVANAPRVVDLDLLGFGDTVESGWPVLPHPRLHERLFVLLPLRDVMPGWRHPVSGLSIEAMLATVDHTQVTRPITRR